MIKKKKKCLSKEKKSALHRFLKYPWYAGLLSMFGILKCFTFQKEIYCQLKSWAAEEWNTDRGKNFGTDVTVVHCLVL